jgi:hypothetical protein
MARIFHDSDAPLEPLAGKRVLMILIGAALLTWVLVAFL